MSGKLGTAAVCLLFAVPFGGVGAFTGWLAGSMIYDGLRARDWVRVKADAVSDEAYRYVIDGREHVSERVTLLRVGTSDLADAGYEAVSRAHSEKRPFTVFVNPADPKESVVDRTIPWKFVVGMTPFVFGFGGVGVGALWFLGKTLIGSPASSRKASGKRVAAATDVASGVVGIWVFAFFWNIIAIPISLLVVPDAVRNGEWAALLVLIFPLIGLLMIWGAVSATIQRFRGGKAEPRVEAPRKRMVETMDLGADAATVAPEPETPVPPRIAALMQRMGQDPSSLSPEQRAQLARLTPGQEAAIGNIVKAGPWLKKIIIAGVVLFVAFQVLGIAAAALGLVLG